MTAPAPHLLRAAVDVPAGDEADRLATALAVGLQRRGAADVTTGARIDEPRVVDVELAAPGPLAAVRLLEAARRTA